MKIICKLLLYICVIINSFCFSSCTNPCRRNTEFIHRFYNDLYVCDNKDSVVKANVSSELLAYLRSRFVEEYTSYATTEDDPVPPSDRYSCLLFCGEVSEEYVENVIRIVPLNREWYQVYVSEHGNCGDYAIVYLKINKKDGIKIDELLYSRPHFEIDVSALHPLEQIQYKKLTKKYGNYLNIDSGLIWIEKNGYMGCVNLYGDEIIPCKYTRIEPSGFNDIYKVWLDRKCGLVNLVGCEIQPCMYDEISDYKNYRAKVAINGKYGYIGANSSSKPELIYDYVGDFEEFGVAKVSIENKYGYIDEYEQEIFPCVYDEIEYLASEHIAKAKKNGAWGYLKFMKVYGEIKGVEIIPCQYEDIKNPSDGLIAAKKDGKWGYIDMNGNTKIKFVLGYAGNFSNGTAIVSIDGWNYIMEKNGKASIIYDNSNRSSISMKRCKMCNGTGKILITGGGMTLGTDNCPSCGGLGQIYGH